jgi:hypothetical protein
MDKFSFSWVARKSDGSPDIAVRDGILIVGTLAQDSDAGTCRRAVALTLDRSVRAGIKAVWVIDGLYANESLAALVAGTRRIAECETSPPQ